MQTPLWLLAVLLVTGPTACASADSRRPSDPEATGGAPTASRSATARETAGDDRVLYQGAGIFVVPRDGGSPTRLSGGLAGAEHPDWSPDGATVVFESEFAGVYRAAADGSAAPRRLWSCSRPCVSVHDAAWSPDGTEIAVAVAESRDDVHTSRSAVLSIDVASGAARTVVADRSGRRWLFAPRWSGDGRRLVLERDTFASRRLDEGRVLEVAVLVVSARGRSVPREIAGWAGPVAGPGAPAPDWDRRRDLIVYTRDDNLRLVWPDGSHDRALTDVDGDTEHAIQPTFTPDGRSVVFTHVTGRFDVDDRPTAAVISVDGGEPAPLAAGVSMTHPRLGP
ncbi:MAG: hypothetical protein ABIO66_00405 [Nocardioidaceae bacterium]